MILDGKELKRIITNRLSKEIRKNKLKLKLDIIQIGKNDASRKYIRSKEKMAEDLGVTCEVHRLRSDVKESTILKLIRTLNKDKSCNGIIVQLPIPKGLNFDIIKETIDPKKDIDGFTNTNIGNLFYGRDCFIPCTCLGIIKLLEENHIKLSGANVAIIGRSVYIGKSLMHELINKDATVTMCHSKTNDLCAILKRSDIIICAVGKEKFLTRDMINPGAIIIDVGINFDKNGKLCGDCDFDNIVDICKYITPVPGGVGPMTVASVFLNLIKAYKFQK